MGDKWIGSSTTLYFSESIGQASFPLDSFIKTKSTIAVGIKGTKCVSFVVTKPRIVLPDQVLDLSFGCESRRGNPEPAVDPTVEDRRLLPFRSGSSGKFLWGRLYDLPSPEVLR